ncbi:MAG: DnaA/Hda family protein [Paracoccaceae bacterium]
MPPQLVFDLPARTALGRADFFISPANSDAVALIDSPAVWPLGKLLLIGPAGSGKSHLAGLWAAAAGARMVMAQDLTPDLVADFAASPALVVEDIQRLAGNPAGQEALFYLHNLMLADKRLLLMTARGGVASWGLSLPDLQSRTEGTMVAELRAPDDSLLAAVLVKLFADRQLRVAPTLIPYLISRIDRSFAMVQALVAALDRQALSEGRAISRAMAAKVLDSWPEGREDGGHKTVTETGDKPL